MKWLDGWRNFVGHDEVPGYRDLAVHERLLVEWQVFARALRTTGFWRGLVCYSMLSLTSLICCWRWDLSGGRAALLQFVPAALIIPWLANGRRRILEQLLQKGNCG